MTLVVIVVGMLVAVAATARLFVGYLRRLPPRRSGSFVRFTSGALAGQTFEVKRVESTTVTITRPGSGDAPGAGDSFYIQCASDRETTREG